MPQPAKRKRGQPPPYTMRGQRRVVHLTLPPDLVDEIDAVAKQEARSRASMIEVGMRQWIREWRQRRESKPISINSAVRRSA